MMPPTDINNKKGKYMNERKFKRKFRSLKLISFALSLVLLFSGITLAQQVKQSNQKKNG
jgi:hypothetical protein